MAQKYNYEDIEAGYYDTVFKAKSGPQSKWHHLKFKSLKKRLPKYKRHIDLGCGPGTFVGLLDTSEIESIGADISSNQIDYAKENYSADGKTFVKVDAGRQMPFESGSFDLITIVEVIEHLNYEEVMSLLREAYRLLSPGGKLIVTTPNYLGFWPILEFIVNKTSKVSYEEQHIQKFTSGSLKKILKSLEFSSVKVSLFQGFAFFAAIFSWKLADIIYNVENKYLSRFYGFLLIGEARK